MNERFYDIVVDLCIIASIALGVLTAGLLVYGDFWNSLSFEQFLLTPVAVVVSFVFIPIWLLILVVLVDAVERLIRPVVSLFWP